MRAGIDLVAAVALGVVATAAAAPASAQGTTERVSVGPAGIEANSDSFSRSAVSADGRFVAFQSSATNLVPGDTNASDDIFVRDRQAGVTRRVSVGQGGAEGNQGSFDPAISADGRFVAFSSEATNLVSGDTNFAGDVFVRDRRLGVTRRVSVGQGGAQGDDGSFEPAISASGRLVAFASFAGTLVPSDTNGRGDVFVRDRRTGVTRRVSVGPGGAEAESGSFDPAISADGRFVAFRSDASNLVARDTNASDDIFVHDRQTGLTRRVSVGPGGVQGNSESADAAISADGRLVAFASSATNLVPGDVNRLNDVFVRDRQAGVTHRVSVGLGGVEGNNPSRQPAISADARFVAFLSQATNLVPRDTTSFDDVFVRDLRTGLTRRVNGGLPGVQANNTSHLPSISANGRFVAFSSSATNLVPGDTNGASDIFVRDRRPDAPATAATQ